MNWKKEWKALTLILGVFLVVFFLPVSQPRFRQALFEALALARWYAREHVLLCLIPAFFIAGAIAVFVRQASVMKYLGPGANKVLAYGVASVSGSILAVCSCTILPLFAGIYRMGAGLGPATAFLYAGPAINVLAIILTARVLGWQLGLARAVGAIFFSIIIGLAMHFLYRREQNAQARNAPSLPEEPPRRSLGRQVAYFATMVAILVFANWARSGDFRAVFLCCPNGLSTYTLEGQLVSQSPETLVVRDTSGQEHAIDAGLVQRVENVEENTLYQGIYRLRWILVAALLGLLVWMLWAWFGRGELAEWVQSSWDFAKLILPLLLIGVLLAGLLLGRPGQQGLIPNAWVDAALGGNSLRANAFAAIAGAFMYFATLTEVPIVQGLMGSGMGHGPALALLLAGPALSLPNMLVIAGVLGTRKTLVFVTLVVIMATLSGLIYGQYFPPA